MSKLLSSMMCGFYISLGAIVYLIIPDKIVGGIFFALGIFLVLNFNKFLFTRVVPLLPISDDFKPIDAVFALVGNSIGAFITAVLISLTRIMDKIEIPIHDLVEIKLQDNLISLFVMAIFCGILVGYAVYFSRKYEKGSFAQIFYVWLYISAFVFCGFDHIVANSFYFSAYGLEFGFSLSMILPFIVVAIGNTVGGLLLGFVEKKNMSEK